MPRPRQSTDDIRTPLDDLPRGYITSVGTTQSCAIRDLLTELMRVCDHSGVDFRDRLIAAREVCRQELAERRQPA